MASGTLLFRGTLAVLRRVHVAATFWRADLPAPAVSLRLHDIERSLQLLRGWSRRIKQLQPLLPLEALSLSVPLLPCPVDEVHLLEWPLLVAF